MTLTKALSSLLLVLVFVTGAVFAIEKYSDAQDHTTCPANTEIAADGETCLSPAVNDNVVTTTSCIQGVLSDDGTVCIVPRTDTNPTPAAAPAAAPLEAPIPTFTG